MNTHSSKKIINLLLDVSEQIDKKNITSFILSALDLENINYENKLIRYNYLNTSNKYQIFLFNNKEQIYELEAFKSIYEKSKNSESVDVFRINNSFVIYKNADFYFYQELDYYIEDDELKAFIFKRLNIHLDHIYSYSNSELEILKSRNKNIKSDLHNISLNKSANFNYFLFYLLSICILSFSYYLYMDDKNKKDNFYLEQKKEEDLRQLKNRHLYKPFHLEFSNLESLIKRSKLHIESIHFKRDKISFILKTKDKSSFFKFLEIVNLKVLRSSFIFDDEKKIYRCVLDVRRN